MSVHPDNVAEKRARHAAYMRGWMAKNREKARASSLASYYRYKAERIDAVREYVARNKAKVAEYQRAYAKTEQGSLARVNAEHRRRPKKRGCDNPASAAELRAVLQAGTQCHYCETVFDICERPTIDHVVPLSKGGPHSVSNIVAACISCNLRKGARDANEFLRNAKNFT